MPNPAFQGHRAFSWLAALVLFGAAMTVSCVLRPWPDFLCYPCVDDCGDNGLICREKVCVPQTNPDPKQCAAENPEGGAEKTEFTAEIVSEESVNPEDGAMSEEPHSETEPERPETPDTTEPTITLIEGDDAQPQPISYPSGTTPPADAKPATFRFRTSWRIYGANLLRIERWELHSKDNTQTFTLTATDKKDTDMKLTLPAALTAGFFTLLGFIGNTSVVKAETFVLQGKDGKDGAQGPKGDIGDNKFTDSEATLLKALLTKLQANGDNLDITANTVTFKSATAQKVTLDLGNNATLKSGNATLDFAGDTITVKSTTFSTTANRFEAKGSNGTALVLDDTAKTITLEKANVRILNGTTKTDQANGLGNLILGYNDATLPANPPFTLQRTGSHNLVIGDVHSYPTTAGIVAGRYNNLVGKSASILGGTQNQAYSEGSVILGGIKNATGKANNAAAPFYGLYATISGGSSNKAYGAYSSIQGGEDNITGKADDASEGSHASVSGGQTNTASGSHASVSGGKSNIAKFNTSFICGGIGLQETTSIGQVICP